VRSDEGDGDVVAADERDQPLIEIATLGVAHARQFSDGAIQHEALFDITVATGTETLPLLSRRNLNAIAAIADALQASDHLGGAVQDLDPVDTAAAARGKDVAANSIQYRATFLTPEGDWFTLLS